MGIIAQVENFAVDEEHRLLELVDGEWKVVERTLSAAEQDVVNELEHIAQGVTGKAAAAPTDAVEAGEPASPVEEPTVHALVTQSVGEDGSQVTTHADGSTSSAPTRGTASWPEEPAPSAA